MESRPLGSAGPLVSPNILFAMSPVVTFNGTLKNPALYDARGVFTFASNSPVGASISVSDVSPEPGGLTLVAIGLIGLGLVRKVASYR